MSKIAMPYHFRLVRRHDTCSQCRACGKQIHSDQLFYTIVVRWENEFNEMDFCQVCYTNYIQRYFKFQHPISSTDQPELLNFLSNLTLD